MDNKINTVLFDMDWVLVDARDWHYNALNKALKEYWYIITEKEHEEYYDWLPTRVKLNKLSKDKWLPKELHDTINKLKQQYTIDEANKNKNIDLEKLQMLEEIKEKWIKIACCSNSIKSSIELILGNAWIYNCFDLILSNQDVKNSKPSPEIYNLAMERLLTSPKNTIIVEDSPHWIQAAKDSWANVIEVKNATEVKSSLFKNIL